MSLRRTALALSLLVATSFAHAEIVSSLPGGVAVSLPDLGSETGGPAFVEEATFPGGRYVSTDPGSVFGYTGNYGFGENGTWLGEMPMIGLNARSGHFDLIFDDPISGFLGDVNWATGFSLESARIEAYDAELNLLESLTLEADGQNVVATGHWGFLREIDDISIVRFASEFVGVRDLAIARIEVTQQPPSEVPEPGVLGLLGVGLGLLAWRRRA